MLGEYKYTGCQSVCNTNILTFTLKPNYPIKVSNSNLRGGGVIDQK